MLTDCKLERFKSFQRQRETRKLRQKCGQKMFFRCAHYFQQLFIEMGTVPIRSGVKKQVGKSDLHVKRNSVGAPDVL